jgi:hypothetical protein
MKIFQLFFSLGVLAFFPGFATAAPYQLDESTQKLLPVLVQVNAHGKVTDVSPATPLSPTLNRLLRANLDEMIRAPAIDDQGHPTSSQFVINLALRTSPRPDGNYDAAFAYVSTSPVPAGAWYWVSADGRQLALASRNIGNRREAVPYRYDQQPYRPRYPQPSMPDSSKSNAPAPVVWTREGADPATGAWKGL